MDKSKSQEILKDMLSDFRKIAVIILLVFLQPLIISLIYSIINYSKIWNYSFKLVLFSCFLIFLLIGFIIPFVKKISRANLIINIITTIYMTLSQLKIAYTLDPIILSDYKFIKKLPDLFRLALGNTSAYGLRYVIIMFIVMVLFTVISYLILRKNDFEVKELKPRVLFFIFTIIVTSLYMMPDEDVKDGILLYIYDMDSYVDYNSYTSVRKYFLRNGVLTGLYGLHINNYFYEPDGYDVKELQEVLENTEFNEEKTYGNPNIILYFSESFYDLEKAKELYYSRPLCENYNMLKKQNKAISVLSPTYGGMSENVAFEVLTGASNNYLPVGYIPIMSLYDYDSSKEMPSLVKSLNENGYETKIIFGEDDYNSEDAYTRMGFGEYVELRYLEEGKELTDAEMLKYIKEELENKPDDKKAFYVIESYEAHMPYTYEKYDTYDIDIVSSSINKEEDIETLTAYSQAIYNADKELKNLYDYIQYFDEPTIVIFVGDHLPYLYNSKGENVFDKLAYFNTENEIDNLYRKYNTEALIFSNYNIDLKKLPDEIGTNLLLDSVLVNTDNNLDKYYYWLYETKDTLPAINRYIYIDSEGNKNKLNAMTKEQKEVYSLREKMQYMLFIENK